MKRRMVSLLTMCMLASAMFFAINVTVAENTVSLDQPLNPYELVEGTTGFPSTLDPAMCYDPASAELILNVYETLISFDGERSDLFIPLLAEEWGLHFGPFPSSPPYTNYTVWFKIRVGVPFHTWCRSDIGPITFTQYNLTTGDVEYSFERLLIHDYVGGPQLALYEPLLGVGGAAGLAAENYSVPEIGNMIDSAVQSNATHVWFNIIDGNYQPIEFLRTLAQPFCAILSRQWIIDYVIPNGPDMNPDVPGAQVDWDGNWGDYTGWVAYWGWKYSPLDRIPQGVAFPGVTCGTGPYVLDRYDRTSGWSVVKYNDYWRGWPAHGPSPPYWPQPSSGIRPAGWVERFTVRRISSWDTIIDMLLAGEIDLAPVPKEYAWRLHQNGDIYGPTWDGIRLVMLPIPPAGVRCYMRSWVNGWFYSPLYTVPSNGRKFALVVGALQARWPNETLLARCVNNDAMSVAYKLAKAGWRVRVLLGWAATYDGVMDGLNWLANNAEPDDYALFYFSGHGGYRPDQPKGDKDHDEIDDSDEYIVTYDYQAITDDFFTKWVRPEIFWYDLPIQGIWSKHLAIILDSCSSGGFIRIIEAHIYGGQQLEARNGSIILTAAGGLGEHENATVSPFHDRSQFTYHLFVNNPHADLESMFNYAKEKMQTCNLCIVRDQSPQINDKYDGNYMLAGGFSVFGVYAYTMWKWSYIDGDVDFDGKVSMSDIVAVVTAFGSNFWKPNWNFWCDISASKAGWRDSTIKMDDIVAVVSNFGKVGMRWQPPT